MLFFHEPYLLLSLLWFRPVLPEFEKHRALLCLSSTLSI
jgi:hypothetical protein